MSAPGRTASLAAIVSVAFAGGAAAYEPPLPQNKLAPPELGPIEPLQQRFGPLPRRPPAGTDIAVGGLGFGTDGRITYWVMNRGDAAASGPFVVDIEVEGRRADTIKHPPLPAQSQQRAVSNIAESPTCGVTRLRAAADSQRVVAEIDETNNALARDQVPPCPDLTAKVEKDSVNNHLEYYGKVIVRNQGNLAAKRSFTVRVMIQVGATGVAKLKEPTVASLAPGETFTIKDDDKHWNTTATGYHVVLDRFFAVKEADETNNVVIRTIGGL
ncbi:MAG: CARDB domain-containing protein [Gammaproteobacteria bacterium]